MAGATVEAQEAGRMFDQQAARLLAAQALGRTSGLRVDVMPNNVPVSKVVPSIYGSPYRRDFDYAITVVAGVGKNFSMTDEYSRNGNGQVQVVTRVSEMPHEGEYDYEVTKGPARILDRQAVATIFDGLNRTHVALQPATRI